MNRDLERRLTCVELTHAPRSDGPVICIYVESDEDEERQLATISPETLARDPFIIVLGPPK